MSSLKPRFPDRALTNLNGDIGGRLSLATSHHIGLHRLPPLLRAFTRAHPQVSLDIRFLDSEVAYDEVLHGCAELAVITLAPQTAEPVLEPEGSMVGNLGLRQPPPNAMFSSVDATLQVKATRLSSQARALALRAG